MNLRAFSRKEGDPSMSSKASKTGLPMTIDLPGSLSFSALKKRKRTVRKETS